MKKIAIASFTPHIDNIDDHILRKYFNNKKVDVDIISWDDKKYDWTKVDLVLIRSTWDSYNMMDEYKKWLDYLENNNVKVLNDISIIKSNIFKEFQIKYLKDNHIPIMKCEVFSIQKYKNMLRPENTLIETLHKYFNDKKKMYILKPTFSAMANDTYIIDPYNINKDNFFKISDDYEKIFKYMLNKYNDRGVILQQFSPSIKDGEYGMSFLNGKYAMCSKKTYGLTYGKNLSDFNPPNDMMIFAQNIVNKLPKDKVKFARVDIIIDEGKYKVMELELADADLYIRRVDGFQFWLDDEQASIKESYQLGCHEKKLIDFVNELMEEYK